MPPIFHAPAYQAFWLCFAIRSDLYQQPDTIEACEWLVRVEQRLQNWMDFEFSYSPSLDAIQ